MDFGFSSDRDSPCHFILIYCLYIDCLCGSFSAKVGVLCSFSGVFKIRWRCRWDPFTEEEFDEVLRCIAPWKACRVDSVYSFPIKKCQPIRKAVFELVRKMLAWKVTDNCDEKENWLVEGRTMLIFKGDDWRDPANYRPITFFPTITKMVTLAIHKR